MEVLLGAALGVSVTLVIFMATGQHRRGQAQTIVLERTAEGETRVVHCTGSGEPVYPPYTGPPLRSYCVRDDGAVEYSDGEVIEPDKTKINPPDMRLVN